ncbi:rhodanese-like domain-containing protein [Fibrella sp. HMF5335]|uniref:Rhodanese-like domain-containing protein n=1 Tax=Fibrella rubiginis TaxID=2817060 RepID=A0A939K146_9BACT|nr:rhodanese-like domain-containing protein [Fibrella rubiginis]MBO0936772.1 rhodanese-like domain-containing protein [Fibrella rubiginis]
MTSSLRHWAVFGLLMLSWACVQHRPADGTQQASLLPTIDTTGHDLNPAQAKEFIATHPGVVVLDVRTPDEFQAGHIKEATNINLYDSHFAKQLATLDRSKTYVVHCAAGLPNGRSRKAIALMDSLGFKETHHMNGGFSAWQQAGQPVVKKP